ncbi:MAG: type II secretion system protein [Clostridiales bacterium]
MLLRFDNKKGMTLIEVILAITILAIASLPLFASFNNTFLIINKKQKKMDNSAVIRLAKENSVDCIKEAKAIQSYNDVNSDSIKDINDTVLWQNDTNSWTYPDIVDTNTVSDLMLKDSNDKIYDKYKYSIKYDSTYSDSNFPNVKKFKIGVYNFSDSKLIKAFNIFINTET